MPSIPFKPFRELPPLPFRKTQINEKEVAEIMSLFSEKSVDSKEEPITEERKRKLNESDNTPKKTRVDSDGEVTSFKTSNGALATFEKDYGLLLTSLKEAISQNRSNGILIVKLPGSYFHHTLEVFEAVKDTLVSWGFGFSVTESSLVFTW